MNHVYNNGLVEKLQIVSFISFCISELKILVLISTRIKYYIQHQAVFIITYATYLIFSWNNLIFSVHLLRKLQKDKKFVF